MYPSAVLVRLLPALVWLPIAASAESKPSSHKRGLVYTPNEHWPEDDNKWAGPDSGLSWYYDFAWNASKSYASVAQDKFQFVPMMWGAGTPNGTDSYFAGNISATIDKEKRNITHALTFSHPEQTFAHGGSEMKPRIAAQSWINNAIPLQEKGIKVGLPIVGDPYSWVDPFLKNCSALLAKKQGKRAEEKAPECKFDFMPITSYGNMTVLKDRVELFANAFPGIPIWLVEYGFNNQDLKTTQKFFNESIPYLEETEVVERYAWFGAFRSTVSNVGPNAAMLNQFGDLTDIGSWYLGGNATGLEALPEDKPGPGACTADKPCGGKNSGVRLTGNVGRLLCQTAMLASLLAVFL